MTYTKLINTLTAELKKYSPQRIRFSFNHLRFLFSQYKVDEINTVNYCCYGEDTPCWYDVEGPDIGWIWTNHKPEKMPQELLKYTIGQLKPYAEYLYKRKMFVYTNQAFLTYVIPLRDIAKYDIYITFNMVESKSE